MFSGVLGRAEHHSPWNSSMDGGKDVAWLDPAPCGLALLCAADLTLCSLWTVVGDTFH